MACPYLRKVAAPAQRTDRETSFIIDSPEKSFTSHKGAKKNWWVSQRKIR